MIFYLFFPQFFTSNFTEFLKIYFRNVFITKIHTIIKKHNNKTDILRLMMTENIRK